MNNVDDKYVPGTDLIFAQQYGENSALAKDGDIILVPQPTVSPNDPLTWSKTRKYVQLIMVLMFTGLTAATSNASGSAQDGIKEDHPNISVNTFNAGDGVLFLGIAWFTLLSAPSVYLYGSRIGYLFSIVLGIIGSAWFANCSTAVDVIFSQLFIGASESVSEAVAQLSITQVFYQHQANHYIGIYVLTISIGTFLGPLIGGIIADYLSWHWVGYMSLISYGVVGIFLYFFLEETYFDRAHFTSLYTTTYETAFYDDQTSADFTLTHTHSYSQSQSQTRNLRDSRSALTRHRDSNISDSLELDRDDEKTDNAVVSAVRPDIVNEQKQDVADEPKTYWQRIQLITPAVNLRGWGVKQYFKRILLLLQVMIFPSVIYSGVQWGMQDAWLSFYLDLEEQYYYDPPFNYSDTAVGLMNIPCLIGATIGCFYGVWFSDWFVLWIARRNNGIREAESRLWCLLPAGLISPVGMILLGVGTERAWAWYAPYVGLGMIGFGWGCAGDLSMSYLVDCYPEMVLEGMVGVALINNNIATVFSFVVDRWMTAIGPQNTMISIAVLNFFIVFLSLPMIFFGKRCRIWTKSMYLKYVDARDSLNSS